MQPCVTAGGFESRVGNEGEGGKRQKGKNERRRWLAVSPSPPPPLLLVKSSLAFLELGGWWWYHLGRSRARHLLSSVCKSLSQHGCSAPVTTEQWEKMEKRKEKKKRQAGCVRRRSVTRVEPGNSGWLAAPRATPSSHINHVIYVVASVYRSGIWHWLILLKINILQALAFPGCTGTLTLADCTHFPTYWAQWS